MSIDLATLNTNKHFTDPKVARENLPFYENIDIVPHKLELKVGEALKYLLTDKSYNIERFKSSEFQQTLRRILTEHKYSCIIFETIYLLTYLPIIRELSPAIVILRAHNVEHHIWESKAELESGIAKKAYLRQLASTLKEYETVHSAKCDGVICVSDTDAAWFTGHIPGHKVLSSLIGIDMQQYTAHVKTDSDFRIGFIGALDWSPNVEGVEWFFDEVWPEIARAIPACTFHLAGRNMPKELKQIQLPNVINHGEVDNALSFMATLDVLVVPLFTASGIRVKIIEAMAMGKVVVSTSVGLLGNQAEHKTQVLIADSKPEFINNLCLVAKNEALKVRIGKSAQDYAIEHFDEQKLTTDIIKFINTQIDKKLSLS